MLLAPAELRLVLDELFRQRSLADLDEADGGLDVRLARDLAPFGIVIVVESGELRRLDPESTGGEKAVEGFLQRRRLAQPGLDPLGPRPFHVGARGPIMAGRRPFGSALPCPPPTETGRAAGG